MSRFAEIYKISECLNFLKEDTLFLFDIDETLTIYQEPAFQPKTVIELGTAPGGILHHLSLAELDFVKNFRLTLSPYQLIETNAPEVVKSIQKKCRAIVLTAALTRHFNGVFFPKLRYEELKRFDIDFSNAFPETQELIFDELPSFRGSYPLYYRGLLCTNGEYRTDPKVCSKGVLLCEFLRKIKWKPKHIILLDDIAINLEKMQEELHAQFPEISYQGLHYIGARNISTPVDRITFENKWKPLLNTMRMSQPDPVDEK